MQTANNLVLILGASILAAAVMAIRKPSDEDVGKYMLGIALVLAGFVVVVFGIYNAAVLANQFPPEDTPLTVAGTVNGQLVVSWVADDAASPKQYGAVAIAPNQIGGNVPISAIGPGTSVYFAGDKYWFITPPPALTH